MMEDAVYTLLEEFQSSRYESVTRWRNTFHSGRYERECLTDLAGSATNFRQILISLSPKRIEQRKSNDPRIRSMVEDRILSFYKELVRRTPSTAICMYRRVKSFYRANYVSLESKDPTYTVQRERDYLASKEETRKMCELLDSEGKAYLLTLAKSCGSPGAVANLGWKYVNEEIYTDKVPMKIWLKHKVKLTRKNYFTFICEDAKEALKLWLETRGQLKTDDRVFCSTIRGLRRKVMKAAEKIGICPNVDIFVSPIWTQT